MKKIIISTLLISTFLCPLYSNDLKLSRTSDTDKKDVEKSASIILKNISKHNYEDLKEYFTEAEANYNGIMWMPISQYIPFIKAVTKKGYSFSNIQVYNFDDCKNRKDLHEHSKRLYKIFNNYSLMVIADAKDNESKKETYIGLIFIKNSKKKWRAYSLFGLGANALFIPDKNKLKNYNPLLIKELSLEIPIHKNFQKFNNKSAAYTFFMPGKTPRDAAIQIVYFPKKDDLLSVSYSWVMYNLKNRRSTPIIAKYFQGGYWFECNIKGNDNIPNKMIIIAQENDKYYTFINFFSFLDFYKKNYQILNTGLINIKNH